jgi:hypothetical protein
MVGYIRFLKEISIAEKIAGFIVMVTASTTIFNGFHLAPSICSLILIVLFWNKALMNLVNAKER